MRYEGGCGMKESAVRRGLRCEWVVQRRRSLCWPVVWGPVLCRRSEPPGHLQWL